MAHFAGRRCFFAGRPSVGADISMKVELHANQGKVIDGHRDARGSGCLGGTMQMPLWGH